MRRLILAALAATAHPALGSDPHERAGFPQEVRPHAIHSTPPRSTGGYVGGGRLALPKHQDGRVTPTDGTWGWDYVGLGRRPGRVFLDWWHDRPKAPPIGPYRTDGPEVPDPIAAHPVQKFIKGEGGGEKH